MNTTWIQTNDKFVPYNNSSNSHRLEKGVYKLQFSTFTGFYLQHVADNFTLPSPHYNFDKEFSDRVVNSWNRLSKNTLAILLNGEKGSGKSVTAKVIAENSGAPIIIIDNLIAGFSDFIGGIQQDCVIFLDEFEKMLDMEENEENEKSLEVLRLLDGTSTLSHKTLFIMTSNNTRISRYLISRPGRIRYFKTFESLSMENCKHILYDKLVDKTKIDEVARTISRFKFISMDSITSFIEEVNLYPEISADKLILDFNISLTTKRDNLIIQYYPDNDITKPVSDINNFGQVKNINISDIINSDLSLRSMGLNDHPSPLWIDNVLHGFIIGAASDNSLIVELTKYSNLEYSVLNDMLPANKEPFWKKTFPSITKDELANEYLIDIIWKYEKDRVKCVYKFEQSYSFLTYLYD